MLNEVIRVPERGVHSAVAPWKRWLAWAARIIVGAAFILSGFAKGVDPWGTIYKMADYLAAWGLDIPFSLVLIAAMALCCVEFLIGAFIFMGCFRRGAPIAATVVMAFMLPLSLWIALKNPVPDCGCFGDLLHLSNWQTFAKNIVLTICAIWLIPYQRRTHWFVTPALQWLFLVCSGVFIVIVELIGYVCQPMLDFRPYPEGGQLVEFQDSEAEDLSNITFVYRNGDIVREFGIDELPDESEGWEFVERNDNSEAAANDKNLRIYTPATDIEMPSEDVTEDVVAVTGPQVLVFFPDIDKITLASAFKVNSLYDWCREHSTDMVAIAAGSDEGIARWQDLSMAQYPIYTADDTQIKEVVRGDPAVVYLKDGIIEWKSTLRALPVNDFMTEAASQKDLSYLKRDFRSNLLSLIGLYVALSGILVLMSFTPGFWTAVRKRRKHGNNASHHRQDNH